MWVKISVEMIDRVEKYQLVDSVRFLVVPLVTASLKVLLGREYGSRLKLTIDNERARNFLNFNSDHARAHVVRAIREMGLAS